MDDANFLTGRAGLIAIDKLGNQVLFLDPVGYGTELALDAFTPHVHEVLVAPNRGAAFVPIYGDGVHGRIRNPGT